MYILFFFFLKNSWLNIYLLTTGTGGSRGNLEGGDRIGEGDAEAAAGKEKFHEELVNRAMTKKGSEK